MAIVSIGQTAPTGLVVPAGAEVVVATFQMWTALGIEVATARKLATSGNESGVYLSPTNLVKTVQVTQMGAGI